MFFFSKKRILMLVYLINMNCTVSFCLVGFQIFLNDVGACMFKVKLEYKHEKL